MKIIKQLCEYIEEELCDAEKYVEKAIKIKDEYPDLAETFYHLSVEEMSHMSRLHDEAEKLITNYRRQNGEPPEAMLAVYNYLHGREIAKAKEVKIMQSMYRE